MTHWTTASAIVVIALFSAAEAEARGGGGRGGGGGFGGGAVRGGAASNGGFSSGGSVSTGSGAARAQPRDKASQLPAGGRGDWDSGARPPGLAAGIVVGVAIARRSYLASDGYYYYYDEPISSLPCTPREINVGGAMYYQCGSAYYMLTYEGGSVVYVQVDPPPGYQ